MTECERAKQWLSENWEGDFWDEDVRSLMQFMREEQARGLKEFVAYVERKRWTGDLKTLPQYMADFTTLREEGRQ